jgi:diguanylate cyclase (GGDEF)-like protein
MDRTRALLEEQGFSVVGGDVEFASARSEANIDHLTQLANLRALETDLPRLLSASATAQEPLALVAFDIDEFKSVNDNQGGHATGDEALVAVARISVACVKGKGTAYRLGGDEFAIVLPNHSAQEALAVAERIRRTVNEIPLTSHRLSLSVSIGVAEFPTHGNDVAALRRAADAATYEAKSLGRNLVRFFGEPAPIAPAVPYEPERRQPEPSGLTGEQSRQIKLDYFRNHFARCPHDNAMLNVKDTTALGDKTNSIYVNCPFCGLSEMIN